MPVDRAGWRGHRRSRAFEAILLASGAPAALAGHLVGNWLAKGVWPRLESMDSMQVQAWFLTGGAFALAAAVHVLRSSVQRAGRRIAATMRAAARRRWSRGRTHGEFARAYRAAGWACALAVALLTCALLAALGIEPIDQSLAVVAALAVAMFARLVLRVFAGLRFRPLACLASAFALWSGVGWLGIL